MKNRVLILCISLSLMLSCWSESVGSPPPQQIPVERSQLIDLTKQAEKAALYEAQNRVLIVENGELKKGNEKLTVISDKAKAQAATYKHQRNINRYALAALLLAIVASMILRFKTKK